MLDWKKLILYPAAIYAAIFLFISALIGFKIDQTASWVPFVTFAILIVGFFVVSRAANVKDLKKALILGLVWVAVMVVLDLILTMPFTGADYFKAWTTYLSYAIVLLMPVIVSRFNKN